MSRPIIIDGHADTLHSIWNGSPRFAERVEGEALADAGYSDADVAKVLGGNWLRVIRATLG